jgi:hypothetical protein
LVHRIASKTPAFVILTTTLSVVWARLRHCRGGWGAGRGLGMKTALIIMLIGALLASARSAQAKPAQE